MVSQVCCTRDGNEFSGVSIRDILKVPAGVRCDIYYFGSSTQTCLQHVFYQLKPLLDHNEENIVITIRVPVEMMAEMKEVDEVFKGCLISSQLSWVVHIKHIAITR